MVFFKVSLSDDMFKFMEKGKLSLRYKRSLEIFEED